MKFLFVAPRFHTNQFTLVQELINKGNEVQFWVQYIGAIEDHNVLEPSVMKISLFSKLTCAFAKRKLSASEYESKRTRLFFPGFFSIISSIRQYNPDVVVLREYSKTTFVVYSCCRVLGIRNVIVYNQKPLDYCAFKSTIKRKIADIFFPKVRYTPVKEYCLLNGNSYSTDSNQHSYFVPFVINSYYGKKEYLINGKVNILDVGKFREYKNHKILIEALSKIRDLKNVHLTIVGQASNEDEKKYLESLYKLIDTYNLNQFVSIETNVEFSNMKSLYLQNDILVLPSIKEEAGISVLEAMSYGLYVISTDNNGTAFYVKEGGGTLFNHLSSNDLAFKLSEAINKPELIRKAGNKSRTYISDNCSIDKYISAMQYMLQTEFN